MDVMWSQGVVPRLLILSSLLVAPHSQAALSDLLINSDWQSPSLSYAVPFDFGLCLSGSKEP